MGRNEHFAALAAGCDCGVEEVGFDRDDDRRALPFEDVRDRDPRRLPRLRWAEHDQRVALLGPEQPHALIAERQSESRLRESCLRVTGTECLAPPASCLAQADEIAGACPARAMVLRSPAAVGAVALPESDRSGGDESRDYGEEQQRDVEGGGARQPSTHRSGKTLAGV